MALIRPAAVATVLGSPAGSGPVFKGSYTATPSDDTDLPRPGCLWLPNGGAVSFIGADGQPDTWGNPDTSGVTAGGPGPYLVNVLVTRVLATGTTAPVVKVLVV